MHVWQSKQVLKSHPLYNLQEFIKKNQKGTKTDEWAKAVKSFKWDKRMMLNLLPRVSKKKFSPSERKEKQ
jgi:hypothetical protein